jgi:Zn-dependent peptidase ImmA (M78 family)
MHEAITPITAKDAYTSLRAVGYPRPFIEKLLPEWWDNSLLKTSGGAFQFAMILKQRLGLNVSFTQDGKLTINQGAPHARFKRRSDTTDGELAIAASMGLAISQLALFSNKQEYMPLPKSPKAVRAAILTHSGKDSVDFEGLLSFCWTRGIPVLFLSSLPQSTKRMAGMAAMVNSKPAIVLGFRHTHQARQLFILAHELGHIVCNHLSTDDLLIDEDISEVTDQLSDMPSIKSDSEEQEADEFAMMLIRNDESNLVAQVGRQFSATKLATSAMKIGLQHGIDPGHIILSYAKEYSEWSMANQALRFFPSASDAMNVLSRAFLHNCDITQLSDENRGYLLTIQGFTLED